MALRPFNSISGFSVGETPEQDIILANGDITTVNFTANGVSNLGPVGNVIITGGTVGQVLTTDGSGNLTWENTASGNSAAPMPSYVPVGESYIVPENFQGLFSVPITIDGVFEVDGVLVDVSSSVANSLNSQVLFDDNGELTGNVGFTFDKTTGNLSVPGAGIFGGSLIPTIDVTYDLGSPLKKWKDLHLSGTTIYLGAASVSSGPSGITMTNSQGGEFVVSGTGTSTTSSITNGNSNVIVNDSTINFSANSIANVLVVDNTGTIVTGNVATTGIKTDNYYYANGVPLDVGGNPGGANTQVQFNNEGEFGATANLTFNSTTNVLTLTGNIVTTNANLGNVVNANYFNVNSGCVTLSTSGVIAVSGTSAGVFVNTITDINFGLASNITMGSTSGATTVRGTLQANGITSLGNVSGTYLTGTLTTNAQPNVTSVGTLTNLTVSGNISTGNITVTNTVDAVNIKVTDLYTKRPAINITTGTLIDTFPISEFRSAKYTMRAGSPDGFQALEVLLVHNDINSIITVYGSLSTTGADLVVFDTDISAGNVNVYATAVGPSTNLNLMGTYVPD